MYLSSLRTDIFRGNDRTFRFNEEIVAVTTGVTQINYPLLKEKQDHTDVIITYGMSSCWNAAKSVEFVVFETPRFTHNE